MKILYINSLSADYIQDLTYSGLVKTLGLKNVVDIKWNKKYHIPHKKYPKNLGYIKHSFLSGITRSDTKAFDLVLVGSAKVDCFETYINLLKTIPSKTPIVFIDGGDKPEIGADLSNYKRPELYEKAISIRPFDIVFKREMLAGKAYGEKVFPLPMSFNMNHALKQQYAKKYDVSFWAVESHQIRIDALNLLQEKFDCPENGTVRNQVFSKYKRKGQFYLEELARCKIVLNFRGGGWDTLRYWEAPAVGSLMISQKPQFSIPNNFENGEHVVYCNDDLSDLIELCDYYLSHETEREKIAEAGHRHLIAHHTDIKRANYILDTIKSIHQSL